MRVKSTVSSMEDTAHLSHAAEGKTDVATKDKFLIPECKANLHAFRHRAPKPSSNRRAPASARIKIEQKT